MCMHVCIMYDIMGISEFFGAAWCMCVGVGGFYCG